MEEKNTGVIIRNDTFLDNNEYSQVCLSDPYILKGLFFSNGIFMCDSIFFRLTKTRKILPGLNAGKLQSVSKLDSESAQARKVSGGDGAKRRPDLRGFQA